MVRGERGPARFFALHPPTVPDWNAPDEVDPNEELDQIVEQFKDESTSQRSRKLREKAEQFDWLTQEHKALVMEYSPVSGDVSHDGIADKHKLQDAATALFDKVKNEMSFINFYQCRQFANLFAEQWGFLLVTQGNSLRCFYAKSSTKRRTKTVSLSCQRERLSLKCDCTFSIHIAEHPQHIKEKKAKHRKFVRISKCELSHSEGCNPSIQEFKLAAKSAGKVMGRHCLQPHKMTRIDPVSIENNVAMLSGSHNGDNDDDAVKPGGYDDYDNDHHDNSGNNTLLNSSINHPAEQKVDRAKMLRLCQTLTEYATKAKPADGIALFSSVAQLVQIAQGNYSLSPSEVVDSAAKAFGSMTGVLPPGNDNPLPGVEANREGRPRTERPVNHVMATHGGTAPPNSGKRKAPQCSFCGHVGFDENCMCTSPNFYMGST